MARKAPARVGCLSLLIFWLVVGTVMLLDGSFGDDEAAERFAWIGIAGLVLYVLIFGVTGAANRLSRNPRGFPIDPPPGDPPPIDPPPGEPR